MSEQGVELLRMLFQVAERNDTDKKRKLKRIGFCENCGKRRKLVCHHIVYKPPKIVRICKTCHSNITTVNSIAAVILRRALVNEDRFKLWKWFLSFKEQMTEHRVAEALGINHVFTTQDYNRISTRRRV